MLHETFASADWTIDEASCGKKGDQRHDLILAEMPVVVNMAATTAAGFSGTYGEKHYETMMPRVKRQLRSFSTMVKQVFTNVARAATQQNDLIDYKIKCEETALCKAGEKRPEKPTIRTSAEVKALPVDNRRFFVVSNSVAAIILHEMTHFTKVTAPVSPKQRALDYAYGYYDSAKLAAHEYDRQCYVNRLQSQNTKGGGASSHVMCPKSKDKTAEGICSPARAVQNADSYKFIAAPTYWGTVGKKPIALPAAKKTTKRNHPRELLDRTSAACSEGDAVEDMLIDWIMEEPTAETNLIST
ncbi:hypothetical protein N0V82_008693 [Gnomoniopsis sp. IMI 355080]|nr:hypothetical protein N0V82_008693 [Gnomoniopsis sp. IMI 355080]